MKGYTMRNLFARFDAQVAICGALGAASVIIAPCEEAKAVDIVYYEPNGGAGWVVPNNIDGMYINVETQVTGAASANVAGWDVNPYGTSTTTMSWFGAATPSGQVMLSTPGIVSSLPQGFTISSSSIFGNTASSTTATVGAWTLNARNYVGYRFVGADTFTHYGWLSMDVGATMGVRKIMQVSYNSVANAAITIPAAVPEPSTVVMGLLAAGATGVIAWRRRKQAA